MITELTLPLLFAADDPTNPMSGILSFAPFIIIGILFYVMLMRPERQKKRAMEEMISQVKKNDRIVTIGGIFATVASASKGSEEVTIKIDENNNTKIRVLRSSIARVITDEKTSEKAD